MVVAMPVVIEMAMAVVTIGISRRECGAAIVAVHARGVVTRVDRAVRRNGIAGDSGAVVTAVTVMLWPKRKRQMPPEVWQVAAMIADMKSSMSAMITNVVSSMSAVKAAMAAVKAAMAATVSATVMMLGRRGAGRHEQQEGLSKCCYEVLHGKLRSARGWGGTASSPDGLVPQMAPWDAFIFIIRGGFVKDCTHPRGGIRLGILSRRLPIDHN